MNFFKRTSKTTPSKKLYLVIRSEYELPLGHRVVEFEANSLLDWVQKYWITPRVIDWEIKRDEYFEFGDMEGCEMDFADSEEAMAYTEELVGDCDYFSSIWVAMLEWGKKPPKNEKQLREWALSISVEDKVTLGDGYMNISTNDDEIDMTWSFITQDFAEQYPERVSYVLYPEWQLPKDAEVNGIKLNAKSIITLGEKPDGKGYVYAVFITSRDGATISDITGSFKFEGVRLPEFGQYLLSTENPFKLDWNGEMRQFWEDEIILLKAFLVAMDLENLPALFDTLGTDVNKLCANRMPIASKLYEDPHFLTGNIEKIESDIVELDKLYKKQGEGSVWSYRMCSPRVDTAEHFCQIRHVEQTYNDEEKYGSRNYVSSVFYFDDLWVEANPSLAESLISYSKGIDFLEGEDEKRMRTIDKEYIAPTEEEKRKELKDAIVLQKISNLNSEWFGYHFDSMESQAWGESGREHYSTLISYAIHKYGYKIDGLELDPENGEPVNTFDFFVLNLNDQEREEYNKAGE